MQSRAQPHVSICTTAPSAPTPLFHHKNFLLREHFSKFRMIFLVARGIMPGDGWYPQSCQNDQRDQLAGFNAFDKRIEFTMMRPGKGGIGEGVCHYQFQPISPNPDQYLFPTQPPLNPPHQNVPRVTIIQIVTLHSLPALPNLICPKQIVSDQNHTVEDFNALQWSDWWAKAAWQGSLQVS